MNWDNHNEWVEIARIGAPILAAVIAGAIAICVLRENMRLGRANLRAAIRTTERSIKAAESREVEKWRREQLIERSVPIFEALRRIEYISSYPTDFQGTVKSYGVHHVELRLPEEVSHLDLSVLMHELSESLWSLRPEIELICSHQVEEYLEKLAIKLDQYTIWMLDLSKAQNTGREELLDTTGRTIYLELDQLQSKIQDAICDIGSPVERFTVLMKAEMGLSSAELSSTPTSVRTGAGPEPGAAPAELSPEPES
ncbi:hypothetical protein [Dietzia maris]|uniref:hypothetical protein n=1 Tax=Dietzia maris TaxID=37915 RepID=UPI00223B1E8D|nr:hypothetical protein [Dietzia maris]MCT1433258.1 hypothetical protein [Dietzia maris]MCT1520493.1 hypothetical protein [Dietzia maris]